MRKAGVGARWACSAPWQAPAQLPLFPSWGFSILLEWRFLERDSGIERQDTPEKTLQKMNTLL